MPSPNAPRAYPLDELARLAGARVDGDGAVRVDRVGTLENATAGAIAFLANLHYRAQLASTRASALIVAPAMADATALPKLVSDNPYATYAKVAALLHPAAAPAAGIDPTAIVDPTARVAQSASIGAYARIGARAEIGERVALGSGCAIGDGVTIAEGARLYPNAVVYDRCVIGRRTIVHAGAVIGADGFGMAEEAGRWIKIPQVGRVVIGADVEIGANTTIDRGAIDDTVIEDGVKLDNQIQIGHNCRIGAHTAIAGCVGIAGSTRIGRNCKIGGAAMLGGHIDICDGVVITAATAVKDSIAEPGVYSAAAFAMPQAQWLQVLARLRRLRSIDERLAALERATGKGIADE